MSFRFLGIPLQFHFSSIFLILIVFQWGHGAAYRTLPQILVLPFAALFVVALLLSLLLHERAHIYVADKFGIGCTKIVVIAFGGIALLTTSSKKPKEEFWVAIAGPLASLALAGVGYLAIMLSLQLPGSTTMLFFVSFFALFTQLNVMFGIFNLILPIYPLDGGRIFFSALWAALKNRARAKNCRKLCKNLYCGNSYVLAFSFYTRTRVIFLAHLVQSYGNARMEDAEDGGKKVSKVLIYFYGSKKHAVHTRVFLYVRGLP